MSVPYYFLNWPPQYVHKLRAHAKYLVTIVLMFDILYLFLQEYPEYFVKVRNQLFPVKFGIYSGRW